MFSGKDLVIFTTAAVLVLVGYGCMIVDPEANGFGALTLFVAPPLLIMGFLLPVAGIVGTRNLRFLLPADLHDKVKHIAGLLVFLIAFIAYFLTLEPTASLWDCGETIAAAYKLQVPHTPGIPFTLLIGRLFTMLSFGDVTLVARCLNLMSGFFSASCVFIVYHLIHYFGNRMMSGHSPHTRVMLLFAAVGGSLCLAFSDTFWFSAVEAETYGIACFFMLVILVLILRGKDQEEPLRSRYLVLIGYFSALAYCIHPMCVLVLPVLPFAWYLQRRKLSAIALLLTVLAGLVIVFSINRFVAIGLFELSFYFDLLTVNSLGLPFYSGAILLFLVLVCLFIFLLKRFRHHTAYTWSVIFLLAGFLPYLMLFIRSGHNPPIDETNPQDLALIKAYMNRESYPSSPLLTGPYFDARIEAVNLTGNAYYKSGDEYHVAGSLVDYTFEKSRTTFLPRMYSRDPDHIAAYQEWAGLKPNEKPRFIDNISFMFRCQLGHMYLRYFLWNFAGREGDIQGSAWLVPWDGLSAPGDSKARNQYWMIPLLLGICGAFAQYKADRKGFFTNAIFFLITGIVLAVYLNSPPVEPRERDYIYVASYIAYAVWTGLGVLALAKAFSRERVRIAVAVVICTAMPAWMLYQNADDHDRSGRTFQMDYARMVLNTCAPGAILFTGGDNDTFPLWYLQEVEGVRPDVRVCVLSYMNTDWYIGQLRNHYYASPPFRLSLSEKEYRQYGPNDVLYIDEQIKGAIDMRQYLELLKKEHPALRQYGNNGDPYHILPSRKLRITLTPEVIATATTDTGDRVNEMYLTVTGDYLQKNALAVMDVLLNNYSDRPVYFNFTSMNTLGIDLKSYLSDEGMLYRLVLPEKQENGEGIPVDRKKMYKNLVTDAHYDNLARQDVYFNHEDFHLRMIIPLRHAFNTLAAACLEAGDREMAIDVLNHAVKKLHHDHLETSYADLYTIDLLITVGHLDNAKTIARKYFHENFAKITNDVAQSNRTEIYFLGQAARMLEQLGEPEFVATLQQAKLL